VSELRPQARASIGVLATVGLLSAVIVAVTYTPMFAAKALSVRGAVHLSPAHVLDLAGLREGTNVAHLDVDAVEAAVERDPWVASASVARDLPSTVTITLTERRPIAVVEPGAQVVSADGTVLPGARAHALPEIRSLSGELTEEARVSARTVLEAMPDGLRRQVAAAEPTVSGWITLELRDGVRVAYGDPEEVPQKTEALRAVLAWADREGKDVVQIDVRAPDAPAATLANGQTIT
jgi:cell division protein FtsQ